MTLIGRAPPQPSKTQAPPDDAAIEKKVGYAVAIAVNGLLLYVANNLLEWDILPWLTAEFDRVVPILSVSLVATMLVNAVYIGYDDGWFKSLTQIGLTAISLAVLIRMYAVYPFDFSAYDFNWSAVTRFVLVVGMIGVTIAMIVEAVKLLAYSRSPQRVDRL